MEGVEGEAVVVVRARSSFRFSSSSLLCTRTRISSGAGMANIPYCQCTECPACTKWSEWGPGCWQFRAKKVRWLDLGKQRCSQCAELREARATKGRGRGSTGEASVADLRRDLTNLRTEINDLRARTRAFEDTTRQA